jgi:hypothetical protein
MTEEEYKKEWLSGKHRTDYNDCRFSEDKVEYAKQWLKRRKNNIDFDNPKNIVDLIAKQKIKLITNKKYRSKCANLNDKCKVYTELNKLDMPDLLIPVINVFDCEQKDWNQNLVSFLTNCKIKCILKLNCSSGWNETFVPGISNINTIVENFNTWCSLDYSYIAGAEMIYNSIPKKILVQKVICDDPLDYGFWCVNGKIEGISLTKKLNKNVVRYLAFVNEDGKENKWRIGPKPEIQNLTKLQHNRILKMLPIVNKLSKGLDFVRIDLYCVDDIIYFGEFTFCPSSGVLDYTEIEQN